jgi:hypothetical protein
MHLKILGSVFVFSIFSIGFCHYYPHYFGLRGFAIGGIIIPPLWSLFLCMYAGRKFKILLFINKWTQDMEKWMSEMESKANLTPSHEE